jgi:hypothetical protein
MENVNNPQPSQPQIVYVKEEKSTGVALLLTIFFGPLGLLYVSVVGGLVLTVISLLLFWTVFVPIICWVAAIIWAVIATNKK